MTFSISAETQLVLVQFSAAAVSEGIRPHHEPDWNETMACRCEPTGRRDAAQRLPA